MLVFDEGGEVEVVPGAEDGELKAVELRGRVLAEVEHAGDWNVQQALAQMNICRERKRTQGKRTVWEVGAGKWVAVRRVEGNGVENDGRDG